MTYETMKTTSSNLPALREARDHAAWESVLASIDAWRAHMDGDPEAGELRRIAHGLVIEARTAAARYWQAYARENRRNI
jgi:hypothetical protein